MKRDIMFAGLSLKNPIIAASSSRTNSASYNRSLEEAGVGAVVLKSLFEENITNQCKQMAQESQHTEGADYLEAYLRSNELNQYVKLIKESKSLCTIPVIASINCRSSGEWVDFAKLIEEAGADALELNIMAIECGVDYKDGAVEMEHIKILDSVLAAVTIPVIVKLGSSLSNFVSLVDKLKAHGAAAVVLFNRMYQPDIDIDKLEYTSAPVLSSEQDFYTPLRWVGITSAKVKNLSIALSGGVQNGKDIIKSLVAGASAVEVCSALYKNDPKEWVGEALSFIDQWQEANGYETPSQYCGKMNELGKQDEQTLVRTQFVKYFASKQ